MFGLQRGQPLKRDMAPRQEAEDCYVKDLASFQITNELNRQDMTADQVQRFRASEAAHGDARVAARLIYSRLRYRLGRLNDAV